MRLAERILQWRQFARPRRQSLDGGDGVTVGLDREYQAGSDRGAIDQHRAGAAHAMLAAGMSAGQQELVAQAVEQAGAWLDLDGVLLPVDVEFELHARLAASW